MVISELPVGAVVSLGRYSFPHRSDEMVEIDWIKVSKENDFISQKVLLGMMFDGVERGFTQNNDYSLSNIRQFINSENINWFQPTHPDDTQQTWIRLPNYIRVNMSRYNGLLYHFTDAEIAIIEPQNGDKLRIPTLAEIDGGLPYFKRHGKRAHPCDVYGYLSLDNFKETMYAPYHVIGDDEDPVKEIDRMGRVQAISAARVSGVRPMCKLDGSASIEKIGDNTYKVILPDGFSGRYFRETHTIDWLLEA